MQQTLVEDRDGLWLFLALDSNVLPTQDTDIIRWAGKVDKKEI